MSAPPRPQRGTAEVRYSTGSLYRHNAGTDGARPENGMHSRRKYGLLALTGPVVNTAAAGNQVSIDGHKGNMGTVNQARRETQTRDGTRQRTLPARGMQGANDEEWRSPKWSRAQHMHPLRGGRRRANPHPAARARGAQPSTWGDRQT